MRNLKKILALVLALVMSLSLMATAGAADAAATSSETVTPAYEIALQVLGKDGLKVFGGYTDGTIRPQNNITRAEVAAILYRIVTGDVTDAQAGIYTDMANVNFNDLTGANWAKGYINYCANAQLIVGVGGNQFKPLANITGYATLAMILRALGYDKNGEFKGSGWEIRTASKARELGILKNVSENQLGSSATRELVAELLFRAMLCDKVTYNALTQDYDKTGVTLGYDVFKLEEVEGVVVANEYADIRRHEDGTGYNSVLDKDTTVLRDAKGDDRTVNRASGLEDLGETRVAYTIESGKYKDYTLQNVKLENPGKDDIVIDTYDEQDSISKTYSGTQYFVNFGEEVETSVTNIKITYQAEKIIDYFSGLTETAAKANFLDAYKLTYAENLVAEATYTGSGYYKITYTPNKAKDTFVASTKFEAGHYYDIETINGTDFYRVQIEPKATFNSFDRAMVKDIFYTANRIPSAANTDRIVNGEVFKGTQSRYDYSDWQTMEAFLADCVDTSIKETKVSDNANGYWLKVIDNGKDGRAEWVFQTRYTVASVDTAKDDGTITLETDTPNTTSWGDGDNMNRMVSGVKTAAEDTGLAAGDVVLYAVIDGVARVWKMDYVDGRVSNINRNKLTVTVDGTADPYTESENHEHSARTDIYSGVVNMSGTTSTRLYLDKGGYVAAFAQNIAGNFTLLTDGWFQNLKNGVDYAVNTWDSANQKFVQYDVTRGGELFVNSAVDDGAHRWNRILPFANVNCDLPHSDDVHTIVAYMETDGENATLTPVDTIYDVERQNDRGYYMIDMGKTIPTSAEKKAGTLQTTSSLTRLPYDTRKTVNDARVRALSDTLYLYVYNSYRDTYYNQTINSGASINVHQITGYAGGATWLSEAEQKAYVEDVYVVGRESVERDPIAPDQTFYTANVVVVELNDNFLESHRDVEEVFIYDFPVAGNWATTEEVQAIRADGTEATLKIDLGASRTYTEVKNENDIFTPGLYYLHRTSRTDSEGIYAVERMSHTDIRKSGHYDTGIVITLDYTNDYVEVRDYICGDYVDGRPDDHDATKMTPSASVNPTRSYNDKSVAYRLSYANRNNDANYEGTLTSTTVEDCLRQWYQGNTSVPDPSHTTDYNHNQVLVRYNSAGQIVYAVSFAHGTTTVENYAQRVWRSVTKDVVVGYDLTFYDIVDNKTGDIDDVENNIEVYYSTAKAWQDKNAGKTPLDVEGGSVKITKDGLNIPEIPATLADKLEGATYVVEVIRADGVKPNPHYNLTVRAASDNAILKDTAGNTYTDSTVEIPYNGTETTLENVLSKYFADERGTLGEWIVKDANGDIVKYGETSRWAAGYKASVTVTPECGEAACAKTFTIVFGETVKPVETDVALTLTGNTWIWADEEHTTKTTFAPKPGFPVKASDGAASFKLADAITNCPEITADGLWRVASVTPSTAAAGTTAAFDPATGEVTITGAVAGTSVDIWLVYYGPASDVTDNSEIIDPDNPNPDDPTNPDNPGDDVTGDQPGWDKPPVPTAPRAVGRTLAANEKVPGQEYPYWVFIPAGREIDYATINGTRYAASAFKFDEETAGQYGDKDLYSVNLKFGFSYTISIRLVSKTGPVTPTEVSAVAITWDTTTPVELNGTLPVAASTTEGVNIATEWKDAAGKVVTTADAYGTYTGKVTVTAKEGYRLTEDVAYTVNGTATTDPTAEITVLDPTVEPIEVTAVAITWDTDATVEIDGTLPVASTETEGVTVATEWKNADDETVTTAAAAGTYTGKVTVTAKPGYKLADEVNYTVNGEAATAETLGAEITVKAAATEGDVLVTIDTTGANELVTVKVTKDDGTEVQDGDKVNAGDTLTVVTENAEGKNAEAAVTINDKAVTEYTVRNADKTAGVKIVVTAEVVPANVEVKYSNNGTAATSITGITAKVAGTAYTAKTTAKAGDKITVEVASNFAQSLTVKVNGDATKAAYNADTKTYTYEVAEADTDIVVEVIAADKVTLTLDARATGVANKAKINGEEKNVSGTDFTAQVVPGEAITLEIAKDAATADGDYLLVEPENYTGKVQGVKADSNGKFILTLDAIDADTTLTLTTVTGELGLKTGATNPVAGVTITLGTDLLNDATNPRAYAQLAATSLSHRSNFNEVLKTLYVGVGDKIEDVTFKKAVFFDGTETTNPSFATLDNLNGVDYLVCQAGAKEFKLVRMENAGEAEVTVQLNDGAPVAYKIGDKVTLSGLTTGSRYTIVAGGQYYKLNGTPGGDLQDASDIDEAHALLSTGTSIEFTIPAGITGAIVVTDKYYKYNSSYAQAGTEVSVDAATGSYFALTTSTGTKFVDLEGKEVLKANITADVFRAVASKKATFTMPAVDSVTVDVGYFKVTAAEGTNLAELLTADDHGTTLIGSAPNKVAFAKTDAAITAATGAGNVLKTKDSDGTEKVLNDTTTADNKVTFDCTLEKGAFTSIKVADKNGEKTYNQKGAEIDLAKLVETLGLSDDEYVVLKVGATGGAAKAQKLDPVDSKALTDFDESDDDTSEQFIKVSDLKALTNTKIAAANLAGTGAGLSIGYVTLTIDATSMGAEGGINKGGIVSGTTIGTGETGSAYNGGSAVEVVTSDEVVIYVRKGTTAILTPAAGSMFSCEEDATIKVEGSATPVARLINSATTWTLYDHTVNEEA